MIIISTALCLRRASPLSRPFLVRLNEKTCYLSKGICMGIYLMVYLLIFYFWNFYNSSLAFWGSLLVSTVKYLAWYSLRSNLLWYESQLWPSIVGQWASTWARDHGVGCFIVGEWEVNLYCLRWVFTYLAWLDDIDSTLSIWNWSIYPCFLVEIGNKCLKERCIHIPWLDVASSLVWLGTPLESRVTSVMKSSNARALIVDLRVYIHSYCWTLLLMSLFSSQVDLHKHLLTWLINRYLDEMYLK